MSCYFRHLAELFEEAGIKLTSANRKQVDQAFHRVMGVDYKDCPATWKKLKQELAGNPQKRQELINKLKQEISGIV